MLCCCWCCGVSGGELAVDVVVKGTLEQVLVIMEEPGLTAIFNMEKERNIINTIMTRNKRESLMKMKCTKFMKINLIM